MEVYKTGADNNSVSSRIWAEFFGGSNKRAKITTVCHTKLVTHVRGKP